VTPAVLNFAFRKHTIQKALAVPFDGLAYALHLCDIGADTNDHACELWLNWDVKV
jgi:hypothetical protein